MAEQVLLEEGGVTVTDKRFVAHGVTYALANLTSVRAHAIPADRSALFGVPIGLVAALIAAFVGGTNGYIFAVCALVVAIGGGIMGLLTKPSYAVVIDTSGRNVHAVTTPNRDFCERVARAVSDAIVARGLPLDEEVTHPHDADHALRLARLRDPRRRLRQLRQLACPARSAARRRGGEQRGAGVHARRDPDVRGAGSLHRRTGVSRGRLRLRRV